MGTSALQIKTRHAIVYLFYIPTALCATAQFQIGSHFLQMCMVFAFGSADPRVSSHLHVTGLISALHMSDCRIRSTQWASCMAVSAADRLDP